jgi:hypothetical protein
MADQVVDSATAPSDFRGRAPRAVDQFVGAPHRQDNVWSQEGGVAITVKCEGRVMNVPKTDKRLGQVCGAISHSTVFAESYRDASGKVVQGDHLASVREPFMHACPRCRERTIHSLVSAIQEMPEPSPATAQKVAKLEALTTEHGATIGEAEAAKSAIDRLTAKSEVK